MKITVKKTFEITQEEWQEIVIGFNEEFGKSKTAKDLVVFYESFFLGYSYHALAKDELGKLAGFTSIFPNQYKDLKGSVFLVGLSGSSFVRKEYRSDIFIFHDLYKALRQTMINENCSVILGVPNKNSFKYLLKILNFKVLYTLPYFILPIRIQNIFKNPFTKLVSGIFYLSIFVYVQLFRLISLVYNLKEQDAFFEIFFTESSYKNRFNHYYTTFKKGEIMFTYRIYDEKGVITAYLFDFRERGKRTLRGLAEAVSHIVTNEKIDIIAFIGRLQLKQFLLAKVPEKRVPQQFPLTVDVLVPETDDQCPTFALPVNWSFSLMNFDVR